MNILFDLDGTLINTIADLGDACNYALTQNGFPQHTGEEYPQMVGNGINKLIERSLPAEYRTAEMVQHLRRDFISYYDHHCCDKSMPYSGIPELLFTLKSKGHKIGVASNKYNEATQQIIQHFFPTLFDIVTGERTGIPRKPSPEMIRYLQKQLPYQRTIFIGDSIVDIETAIQSQIDGIVCSWGYGNTHDIENYLQTHQQAQGITLVKDVTELREQLLNMGC